MLSRRSFRLQTLGRLTLSSVAGEIERVEEVRPRHVAVLTVLALSSRATSRDRLAAMFWGGEPEERARHSLSNALSGLRAILGPTAITARREEIELSDEVPLEIDALQFAAACETRDDARAISLYAGPFLAGVHVPDAPEFEQWTAAERNRLQHQFLLVCERHVPLMLRERRWHDARVAARRWLESAPDSSAACIAFLEACAGAGSAAELRAALAEYDRMRDWLRESFGVRPAASVGGVVTRLRDQLATVESHESRAAQSRIAAMPAAVASGVAPGDRSRSWIRTATRPAWLGVGTVAVLLIVLGAWLGRPRSVATAAVAGPVVAVMAIDEVGGDTSTAWLSAGLPRLVAGGLDAAGGIEVIPPSRVRDAIVRLTGSSTARLTDDQALDIGRRLGATWIVTGGVSIANGGYLLDVTSRLATDARQAQSFTVFASNPVELGQLASARLATMLSADPSNGNSSARLSGVETTNPDGYRHYVRGLLAMEGERFAEAAPEFDAAIAEDSGFAEAIRMRRQVALQLGDDKTFRALRRAEVASQSRLPEVERLFDETYRADSVGEVARADALSRLAVERYPRDPRAYSLRADILIAHGRWFAAESVLARELALDSLAISAGSGPCTPCEVLWRLSRTELAAGRRPEAEAAARRWVALQPDLPGAWRNLMATDAAVGRSSDAVTAGVHLMALTREPQAVVDFGRTMLSARRYEMVDSMLGAWGHSSNPILADGVLDLRATLQRERGQFVASVATLGARPWLGGLDLVAADGLGRSGRMTEARSIFEQVGHPRSYSGTGQFTGPEARGFTWSHTLEADALIRAGDTATARSLLDSVMMSGAQSSFGRDHVLHHHLRGMLLGAQGRFADAERELRQGLWGANAWTRTNIELARVQLAQGHVKDAIASLRDAQMAPLDAMGRYVPRSEIDWWLSRAFARAGEPDSARVYAAYVRKAWAHADPPVRMLLDSLR